MSAPMKLNLPYLSAEPDRHGNERLYARRFGRRLRIREASGSPAFLEAYTTAVRELSGRRPASTRCRPRHPTGSLGWLGAQYFASSEFRGLDPASQTTRRGIIERCFAEPFTESDPDPMGNCPLEYVTPAKIRRLRDLKAGLPGAANNRRKYLSAMFAWALDQNPPLMKNNPARDVSRIRYASGGFHAWDIAEVEQFRARHPIGTKPRLALELLLFVGVRKGDLVTLGREHVRGSTLRFVPRKMRYKRSRLSEKPILPILAAVIEQSPVGDLTFLETEYGRPFTAAGFGGWFRKRCNEAALPQCSAHGLRKAGATIAAENGATVHMLMAMYDWETPAQAKAYTDTADRRRLAALGMPLIEARKR
jgi:integrase